MKRSFLLLCTVLLVLGCALPCAAYRLACMALVVQGTAPSAAEAASVTSEESSRVAPSPADTADTVCFTDQSTGQTITLPLREYLIGAVAAEMPVSWPDEALKAQAVAAHSYALYRREDVYKRQVFLHVAAIDIQNVVTGDDIALLVHAQAAVSVTIESKADIPVSYTHLDVYKRQAPARCPA